MYYLAKRNRFLKGIKNEEIEALKRKLEDIDLQLELGFISKDQAMYMKKAIYEQIKIKQTV